MISQTALGGAAILAIAATSVSGQPTQTYANDVHGRLMGATRTTGAMSQTTTYVLDRADNRTGRAVTAPASSLMSSPQKTEQSQAPAAAQGAPRGDQGEDGDFDDVRDDTPNSGGAQ